MIPSNSQITEEISDRATIVSTNPYFMTTLIVTPAYGMDLEQQTA
jgi:hypothetical protein